MLGWLKRLLASQKREKRTDAELEALRSGFKAKYQSFRRLLAANHRALKLMAEIEEVLDGDRAAGMPFIRSRSTRIATAVLQIIRHLDTIAPGKYSALHERFKIIQTQLAAVLAHHTTVDDTALVVSLENTDLSSADEVGGKMAALGELARIEHVGIPEGFVITAAAYRAFVEQTGLGDDINRIIQSEETAPGEHGLDVSAKIERAILASPLPAELENAILAACDGLSKDASSELRVAVRSSAVGEDSPKMSFAGQYRSVLDVKRGDIVHAYKTVVAGKYSPQAMRYRLHHGVRDDEVAMCAGCMPMIEAEWGGVVYTRNPLDEEDDAVHIFASKGLPRNVVDGAGEVETFIVRRDENTDQSLILESGTGLEAETLLDLKRLALATEAHFGAAQDIEWVIGNGDFVFLQCRPLTRRAKKRAPLDKPPDTDGEIVMKGGVTASRGVAAGPVFVATQKADARGFPKGGVLVVTQPLPFWATLFEQAAAVVAENGSIACHLANVAREYGVPALFGVQGAARKLAAGAVVTVDADHQRILQGKPEALPDDLPALRVPEPDSPMTQLTKRVADLILPLRLLDPDDAGFKPERCETLHDITRFCHEKAVQEMFRFGKDHDFSELASRRLYKEGPSQFWIVDLDDGLCAGADDPHFVRFEDIVSIPMLAIWRGMEAHPWEGPPPADPKGFFQVLASSTMDANLDASTPSLYAVGNDVMISKHYCSLQSRFGFHLASAEALVSSRTSENYIHFRFGGGGAGQARKNRRARLVAELLAENGFASEYVKDMVSAHIGGLEKEEMEKRLEIVGYVLVHTRQLDMSMTDDASIERYKKKMMDDLHRLR